MHLLAPARIHFKQHVRKLEVRIPCYKRLWQACSADDQIKTLWLDDFRHVDGRSSQVTI